MKNQSGKQVSIEQGFSVIIYLLFNKTPIKKYAKQKLTHSKAKLFSVIIIVTFIISYFSQEIIFRWIITLKCFTNTRCWSVWRKRRAILALVVVRGFSTLNCKTWLIAPQITLSSLLANPWSDSTVSSTKNLRHSHVSRYFSNQIILYKTLCSSSCRKSDCQTPATLSEWHWYWLWQTEATTYQC